MGRNLPVIFRAQYGPMSSRPGPHAPRGPVPNPNPRSQDQSRIATSGACVPIPFSAVPGAQGLYDPRFEHDACGVAFVADLHGRVGHGIVEQALTALHNLDHRGAAGAEPSSGDGAGITVQVPDEFLRAAVDFPLPEAGSYAVGNVFLPADGDQAEQLVAEVADQEGLAILGWRDVPTVT